MKKNLSTASALLLAVSANAAWAEENEVNFTFAPPPITSQVPEGGNIKRFTVTNVEVDLPDNPISGNGVSLTSRTSRPDSSSFDADYAKGGIFYLTDENDTITVFSVGGGSGAEVYIADNPGHVFTYGFEVQMTNFKTELSAGSLDVEVDTNMRSFGLALGYQHPIYFGNGFAVTPYITYNYNYTMIDTATTVNYDRTETDDDMTTGMATIGFDVTIPGGISLATLMSTGDNDDVRMLQLGFNF